MAEILHITTASTWETSSAVGQHTDPSIVSEGFLHCSEAHQVLGPANRLYHGQSDLILLVIDTDKVTERVVFEDSYGHGSFPHIYGPLNIDAVSRTVDFPCRDDGSFELPAELS